MYEQHSRATFSSGSKPIYLSLMLSLYLSKPQERRTFPVPCRAVNQKLAPRMLLVSIRSILRSSLRDGSCELLENLLGIFPVDASIGDRDTVFETYSSQSYKSKVNRYRHTLFALLWHLLVALVDMTLNHDTHDRSLAGLDLLCQSVSNLGLIVVVLF